jgi:hypothetical protein
MRTVVFLLLLANLSLFAYIKLDAMGGGEAVRLTEQVQPDKIRILSPREVAALGPAKVAALADVCLEWGPFSDADRIRALADLDPLQLGRLLTQRRVESTAGRGQAVPQTVLVVRDPQNSVVTRIKELQAQYAGSDVRVGNCPVS